MSPLKYPGGITPPKSEAKPKGKKLNLRVAPGNRGLDFEAEINTTNDYYSEKGLALITKRPTPIQAVKVDYSHGPKITEAFFLSQSTTDYNGVYKGRYIDFEAKSTRSKTSFPLSNIPPQQISHLEKVIANGGIAFFLVNWHSIGETYLVPAQYIIDFYKSRPRASITLEEMKAHSYLVKEGYRPRYDYLPLVIEHLL